jgi:hypothetical protein
VADGFDPEWAAAAAELWPYLPPAPGAEGTVRLAVALAPRREVAFHWRYEGGKVVDGGAGGDVGVGADGAAGVGLTLAAADATELLSGQVEPSVSFMRGRLKASGDGVLLLAFLSSTTDGGFDEWRRRAAGLAGLTDPPGAG